MSERCAHCGYFEEAGHHPSKAFECGLAKGREEGLNTAWRKLDANGARIRELEEIVRSVCECDCPQGRCDKWKNPDTCGHRRGVAALRAQPAPSAGEQTWEEMHKRTGDAFAVGGEQGDQT